MLRTAVISGVTRLESSVGRSSYPVYETYFAQEGLSYEYPNLKLAGKTREQVRLGRTKDERNSGRVFIVYDYVPFHGTVGDDGSRNYLYLDGHVDALIVADQ